MIKILWVLAAYALAFCAAAVWVWRDMRRLKRRLQQVCARLDDAGAAVRAQAKEAREAPGALERRVEELEQAMDMAAEKRRQEFDITEGLTGLLSYDPYAAMRRKDDWNAE